ncbi:Gfo/Idh/MocA family protein [Sphingomonas sp. SRS2]|uniref:Gfo/Idh/MocA family protein n=1 Tax=Sphingomonas sp. SRS2 TaxID=133190 RepID=UPI00061849BA|nr:Gfo/Idh/MocA family oxidoreductase [Sphingomonas sp. SRS2]KKC24618.1 oxidoreductase [Sphingomonas sp. SRS2]
MTGPRLGFLGVGWIGRNRMEALLAAGAQAVAIADPSPENLAAALQAAPSATPLASLEAMLKLDLDGIVIATPSALHAAQAIEALNAGMAVFCQKPLGRSGDEVDRVLDAARRSDRTIGVDLSYRNTAAIQPIRAMIRAGELGSIYGIDLTFHNAYGPDKAWFYDPALAGGGCLMDLGIHLIDLALWTLDFPAVRSARGRLMAAGAPLRDRTTQVEDYVVAEILLESGAPIRIACSWRLPAGREAVISAEFYGTQGGAALQNISGSFYDFASYRHMGTSSQTLVAPPDDWGGRAAVAWAARLVRDPGYDRQSDKLLTVARLIDDIYASAETGASIDLLQLGVVGI